MRRIRDLMYICSDLSLKRITCYGVEFNQFISFLNSPPQNILLVKHNFYGGKYNYKSRLDYVDSDNVMELISDDVYRYGLFSWFDFDNLDNLNSITPSEIAEILYFGHMGVPLKTINIAALNNRFAYWSQDDGWHNEIYCDNLEDFAPVIGRNIISRIVTKRKTVNNIDEGILFNILNLSHEGMLLDFNEIHKDRNVFEIPLYVIGKLNDMDDMYHNLVQYKNKASKRLTLEYRKGLWQLNII